MPRCAAPAFRSRERTEAARERLHVEDFFNAARTGDVAKLEALLAADPSLLEARNELGQSALLLAKYHRQAAAAAFLLSKNPELTLHEACAAGVLDRVKQLTAGRARLIDTHSGDGFTPLALACFFGNPEVAEYLVNQGANLNLAATNPMRVAPIHAAAASRNRRIVEMLVAAGADVNQRQQQGWTALHAAAQNGDEALVAFLLANGADKTARSETNQSPHDMAMLQGHAGVVALLER